MHYFIDAYNLIFQVLGDERDLVELRSDLIEDLAKKAHLFRLNITLVFDAHFSLTELSRSHFSDLEIVFTEHGQTADEYIIERLFLSNQETTVVTSDKGLKRQAVFLKAHVKDVKSFMQWLDKRSHTLSKKPNKHLSSLKKKDPYLEIFEEPKKRETDFKRWLRLFTNSKGGET